MQGPLSVGTHLFRSNSEASQREHKGICSESFLGLDLICPTTTVFVQKVWLSDYSEI